MYIRAGPSFADLIIRGFINISAAGGWGGVSKGKGGAYNGGVFVSADRECTSPTTGQAGGLPAATEASFFSLHMIIKDSKGEKNSISFWI